MAELESFPQVVHEFEVSFGEVVRDAYVVVNFVAIDGYREVEMDEDVEFVVLLELRKGWVIPFSLFDFLDADVFKEPKVKASHLISADKSYRKPCEFCRYITNSVHEVKGLDKKMVLEEIEDSEDLVDLRDPKVRKTSKLRHCHDICFQQLRRNLEQFVDETEAALKVGLTI